MERSEFEILYGGSRGGGKTDAGIAWLLNDTNNPKYRAIVLRRNSDDLKDWVDRAYQLYSQLRNPAVRRGNPPEFKFKSGAIIRTGHLKDDQAYTKYQGHEYHRGLIEELTQIAEERQYLRLLSSIRSTVRELSPQIFLTTNPGGKGHLWVKQRFIDKAPPGITIWKNKRSRIFIQATMDDNPTLMKRDPNYVANIEALKETDYELYMAWRFGDWDRFTGQVFGEFKRKNHVIKRVIPKVGTHFICIDWGYSDKHKTSFSAYFFSVIKKQTDDGQKYNQIVTYKELCGNRKDPDLWAEIIYKSARKMGVKVSRIYSDPSMHNPKSDGSISIARTMETKFKELNSGKNWVRIEKGNNSRTGRINRIAMVHKWLSMPHGLPFWVMTEDCVHLIRTLPMLVYDDHDPEDIDCFVAGTKVITIDGDKNIEDIKLNELVLTPIGYRKVIKNGTSGVANTIEITLSNGKKLRGTLDHKIFVQGKGLIELQNLEKHDMLIENTTSQLCKLKKLFTEIAHIVDMKVDSITPVADDHFIEMFIKTLMGIFQKIIVFITRTIIMMTTVSQTWKWFISQIMLNIILVKEKIFRKHLLNGEIVQRAKKRLEIMQRKCMNEHLKGGSRVFIVEKLLKLDIQQKNIVQAIVKKLYLTQLVQFVESYFIKKLVKNQDKHVHIVAAGNLDVRTVYNLTIEDAHLYYANDILVTNTDQEDHPYDSKSYGLSMVKFISVKPGTLKPKKEINRLDYDERGLPTVNPDNFFTKLREVKT